MNRLLALAGLALAVLAGEANAEDRCKLQQLAELPVTMVERRPVIVAQLNGREARFTVDSGAFFSLITRPNAVKYGLLIRAAPYGFYLDGVTGTAEAEVGTAKAFGLAGATWPRAEFLVGGSEVGGETVGLLGQNILRMGDVEYDLPDGAIRLFKPQDCGSKLLAYWIKPDHFYSSVRIDDTSRAEPHTIGEVTVNGVRLRAAFDTGAPNSTLTRRAAARAGIKPDSPGVVSTGWMGGLGQRVAREWVAPVASFKIGDEEIKNTRMLVADIDLPNWDMLVGADFFLAHRVYVATSQRQMYFSYQGGPVFNLDAKPAKAASDVAAAAAPTDAAGYARRGAAYAARHDFDAAERDLSRATDLAPQEPAYFVALARARLEAKRPLKAMGALDQALRLKSDDPSALVLRAELQLAAGDKAAAVQDLDSADKAAGAQDDVRLPMGQIYALAGKLPAAIAQYDLWIAAHGEDFRLAEARNGRCWVRALMGQELDKALGDCNAALRMAPRTAGILDSRGLVFLRQGQLDKAVDDYDAALKANPKLAWSLYGRGLAEKRKGLGAQGDADIAAAIALNAELPDKAKAYGLAP